MPGRQQASHRDISSQAPVPAHWNLQIMHCAPMESQLASTGYPSWTPATMGCVMKLPNLGLGKEYLFSNREQATKLQKVMGFIGLFYLRVYRLIFYSIKAEKVCTSVPSPPNPMMMLCCILNTLWKSLVRVSNYLPNLRSQAMPTQSLPTIPTSVPPLYSSMDIDLKIIQNLAWIYTLQACYVKKTKKNHCQIYDCCSRLAFLEDEILDRVKEIFSYFPLLRGVFCRNPIALRLLSMEPRSARAIHRSLPFWRQSICTILHWMLSKCCLISYYWPGTAMVRYRIYEGGFTLLMLILIDLLYYLNSSPSASFLRLRVSQWEQKIFISTLAQLSSSLAQMALSMVSYSTSPLALSFMQMTLDTLPKFLKMLQMHRLVKQAGTDLMNSTLEGLFSITNCSTLGLVTMVLDLRRIDDLRFYYSYSSLRNYSLSLASSRNCSSISNVLQDRPDFLLLQDQKLKVDCSSPADPFPNAWLELSSQGQYLWWFGSWQVLLRPRGPSMNSLWPSCSILSSSQLTPPRLEFCSLTCLSLEGKMFILLPSSKTTWLLRPARASLAE